MTSTITFLSPSKFTVDGDFDDLPQDNSVLKAIGEMLAENISQPDGSWLTAGKMIWAVYAGETVIEIGTPVDLKKLEWLDSSDVFISGNVQGCKPFSQDDEAAASDEWQNYLAEIGAEDDGGEGFATRCFKIS